MPPAIPEKQIFDAVIEVIIDIGYASATTAQIAEAAGIGEATLFRRFGDKETLLKEALSFEVEQFAKEAVAYTNNLQLDLERIVRTYNRLLKRKGRLIFELMNEFPRRPELSDVATIPMNGMSQVTALLERYQKEGKLKGNRPWEATLALLGPVLVVGAFKSFNSLLPAMIEPKEHVEVFLNGWKLS